MVCWPSARHARLVAVAEITWFPHDNLTCTPSSDLFFEEKGNFQDLQEVASLRGLSLLSTMLGELVKLNFLITLFKSPLREVLDGRKKQCYFPFKRKMFN